MVPHWSRINLTSRASIYIYIISLSIGRKQVHPLFELLLFRVGLPGLGVAIIFGWESCMFSPFRGMHVDSEACCSIEEEFENPGFDCSERVIQSVQSSEGEDTGRTIGFETFSKERKWAVSSSSFNSGQREGTEEDTLSLRNFIGQRKSGCQWLGWISGPCSEVSLPPLTALLWPISPRVCQRKVCVPNCTAIYWYQDHFPIRTDVIEDTKAGCFIGRPNVLRLPFDASLFGGRVSSPHGDKNRYAAQQNWPTRDILDLLLRSIKRVSKFIEHDQTGLCWGIK